MAHVTCTCRLRRIPEQRYGKIHHDFTLQVLTGHWICLALPFPPAVNLRGNQENNLMTNTENQPPYAQRLLKPCYLSHGQNDSDEAVRHMSDPKNEQEAVELLQSFERDEGFIALNTKIHQPNSQQPSKFDKGVAHLWTMIRRQSKQLLRSLHSRRTIRSRHRPRVPAGEQIL